MGTITTRPRPSTPKLDNFLGGLSLENFNKENAYQEVILQYYRLNDPDAVDAVFNQLDEMNAEELYDYGRQLFGEDSQIISELDDLYPSLGTDDFRNEITGILAQDSVTQKDINKLTGDPRYIAGGVEGDVFRMENEIAVGEFGVVADDDVVIKVYRGTEDIDVPQDVKMLDELHAAGRGPQVYESGKNYYIADEIKGPTLGEYLQENPSQLDVVKKEYEAMSNDLAARGIYASDLNPNNMIWSDEKLMIVDPGGVYKGQYITPGNREVVELTPEKTKALYEEDWNFVERQVNVK